MKEQKGKGKKQERVVFLKIYVLYVMADFCLKKNLGRVRGILGQKLKESWANFGPK